MKMDRRGTVLRLVPAGFVPGAPSSPPSLKTQRIYRLTDRVPTIATHPYYTIPTTIRDQAQGNAQENGRAATTQTLLSERQAKSSTVFFLVLHHFLNEVEWFVSRQHISLCAPNLKVVQESHV